MRIATHEHHAKFVKENEVEFFPIAGLTTFYKITNCRTLYLNYFQKK